MHSDEGNALKSAQVPRSRVAPLPTHRHVVALTFDGGSDAAGAPAILQTLARPRVKATFFLRR
jgi:peptidoglycan/xylan/chitin deacetylase (PgdA/CDA1 family)